MRTLNLSAEINPLELMDKPPISYKAFYDYYGDWICKVIAAAAYLAAAALFLFPSVAPIAVACGFTLIAGCFMQLGAMVDYHKACAEHEGQITKLQDAMPRITDDVNRRRFNASLQKHVELSLFRCFHYPSISLMLSAASFTLTSVIAALHLAHAITASSIFANPFLLMGLIILNLGFLLVKGSIINRLVEYKMNKINLLSKEVADNLNKTRLEALETLSTKFGILQHHLPAALQRNIEKPVAELRALANALSPSLQAKPNSLPRSSSAVKLTIFSLPQPGAGVGIEQNAMINPGHGLVQ